MDFNLVFSADLICGVECQVRTVIANDDGAFWSFKFQTKQSINQSILLSLERKRLVTEEWDNNSASQIRIRTMYYTTVYVCNADSSGSHPSKQLAPLR